MAIAPQDQTPMSSNRELALDFAILSTIKRFFPQSSPRITSALRRKRKIKDVLIIVVATPHGLDH
jgi:hypothetical protein